MNSLYAEVCVKKKTTALSMIARGALFVAVILLFGLGILLGGRGTAGYLISLVAAVFVVVLFALMPMLKIDYEYIFCDGQIDFDQISGGSRRKNKLRIDMDNIDIMAPEDSHQLDSYRNRQSIKVHNFSSGDTTAKRYVIYVNDTSETKKIIFEPSEKMIGFAKQKAPRKVFID